jgi:hypothetical protein
MSSDHVLLDAKMLETVVVSVWDWDCFFGTGIVLEVQNNETHRTSVM